MKKPLFLVFFAIINFSNCFAQGYLETQKIIASDVGNAFFFGYDVAIEGNIAVIGSRDASFEGVGPRGLAYVFKKDGNGNWLEQQVLAAPDGAQFDSFGAAVAIDGGYIIIGVNGQRYDAAGNNEIAQTGAVYIFKNNGSDIWNLEQKVTASDRELGAWFGLDVAIDGNRLVVGCGRNSYDVDGENYQQRAGAAYFFEKDDNNIWNQVAKVTAPVRNTEDRFGYAVAISGEYATVGAYLEDEDENELNTVSGTGSAYVFKRDTNGVWGFQQKLVANPRPTEGESFGWSLDMDAEYIVAGAHKADVQGQSNGAVHVFKRNTSDTWSHVDKLTAPDGIQGEWFAYDVAIQGDRILLGAYQDYLITDDVQNTHGALYYYLKETGQDTLLLQQKVLPSNWQDPDVHNFGVSVDLDGDAAIVGDWMSNEVNPDTNESFNEAGSVFLLAFDENLILSNTEIGYNTYIKAYPNPFEDVLNLNLESYYDTIHVTIINNLGQNLFSKIYKNTNQIQLEFQDQAKGVYFVEVKTDNNVSSVIKILKR